MSYCKKEGKDNIIFVTQEDHEGPKPVEAASVDGPSVQETPVPDAGSSNAHTPSFEALSSGPCGPEFKALEKCYYIGKDSKTNCCGSVERWMACARTYPENRDYTTFLNLIGQKQEIQN